MRAVDVRVHSRKAVREAFGHEALSRQVITFIELIFADDAVYARIALKARGVQGQMVENMSDAPEPALRVFERDSTHKAMHFVAQIEKIFGQIATILACDAGDQRTFGHAADLTTESADCTDACDTAGVLLRMTALQLPEGT